MPATWESTRIGKRKLVRWLRRAVLATSVFPLLQIYRAIYRCVACLAVRALWRLARPATIYLARGCAKDEIVPGISDIDFFVITNGADQARREAIRSQYHAMAHRWLLLDPEIVILDIDEFFHLHRTNRYFQFRIEEGRRQWRHMRGPELLASLPFPCLAERQGGLIEDLKVWWAQFAARVLMTRTGMEDVVTQNSVCYKAATETLRLGSALLHEEHPLSRSKALENASQWLGPDVPQPALLQRLAGDRFWRHAPQAHEDALVYMLRTLQLLSDRIPTLEVAKTQRKVTLVADATDCEKYLPPDYTDHTDGLAHLAAQLWGTALVGVYRANSVHFDVDETILLLELGLDDALDIGKLREFSILSHKLSSRFQSSVLPYLLFPNFAVQLAPRFPFRSYQSILLPATHPDMFEMVAQARDPQRHIATPREQFAWTPLADYMFSGFEQEAQDVLGDRALYKLDGLSFLRTFWKLTQLALLARTLKTDEMIFPLSIPAIVSGLKRSGHALPEELSCLVELYRGELAGQKKDYSLLVPDAVTFLRETVYA